MKRIYKKPTVIIEEFQVNEYIAGSCLEDHKVNFSAESCEFWSGNNLYFGDNCEENDGINVIDPGNGGTICYHAPEDFWQFFNS